MYRIARVLVAIAMRLYFRRSVVLDRERIPDAGPVILAANHPSGLIDAFVLGLLTRRKVSLTARSTLFESAVMARLLRSLGVLPLYRRSDAAAEMGRNREVFDACVNLLENGGTLGIFPEGVTHVDPQVREMRTGAVRIAFQAEARQDFRLGVRIIPVGLNFSRLGEYRSELTVRVGEPMTLAEHREPYLRDPRSVTRLVTNELRQRIESLVVHLEDPSKASIVALAFEVFGREWVEDPWFLPEISDRAMRELEIRQGIANAIEYYSRFQPAWAAQLKERLEGYRDSLDHLRITEEALRRRSGPFSLLKEALPTAILGILGAPLAIFGWILHRVPERVAKTLAEWMARNPTQLAAYKMWIGLQAFSVAYGLVVLALHGWLGLGRPALVVAIVALPVTGFAASRYFEMLRNFRMAIRATYLHFLRSGRLRELGLSRQRLARDRERIRQLLSPAPGRSGLP